MSELETSLLEEKYGDDIEKAKKSQFDERREHLKEMVFRKIVFDLAEKNNLDTIKTLKDEFSRKVYAQAIMNGFVRDSITSRLYSDEEVGKIYEQRKIKYFPKHILIDTNIHKEGPSKAKIDSIYQRLKDGEKFEDLAVKYSDDKQTGVNGGDLGWVFADNMVNEFAETVLKMKKGEYSEPFKTQYGYHIIYLKDTMHNDKLKSFDKEEDAVRNDLNSKHNMKFNQIYTKIIEDLMLKYKVRIDSSNIKHFIKQYKSNIESVKNDPKSDPLDKFTNEEKQMVFSDFGGSVIDAGKLIGVLKGFPVDKRPELKGYEDIRMYVIDKLRNKILEKRADELGYTKRKEYLETAKLRMYDSYKDKIINHYVRSKVQVPTEDEVRKYYDDNRENYKENDSTYKDYIKVKVGILNDIKGKRLSSAMNQWKKDLFSEYRVKIDHKLVEQTFMNVKDDRK